MTRDHGDEHDAAITRHNERLAADMADKPTPLDLASRGELLAILADLPPRAIAEVVRVLRIAAAGLGCKPSESAPDRTAEDHASHAFFHVYDAERDVESRDAETGALDLVHAACRCLLAAELVLAAEGGEP